MSKTFTELAADASRFLQWFETAKFAAEALAEVGRAEATRDELVALSAAAREELAGVKAELAAAREKHTQEQAEVGQQLADLRVHIEREQAALAETVQERTAILATADALIEKLRREHAEAMAAERETAARLHEEQCAKLNQEAADLEARVAAAREAFAKITGAVGV